MLTPVQRHDLVTKAYTQLHALGMSLIPVTSHQPWLVECDKVGQAYNELADTVRRLSREVDWPGRTRSHWIRLK